MDNIVFFHEVEGDEYLDSKPLDEVKAESLEVVHFYELVEVHAQQFERDNQVLPEHELVRPPNDILFVFGVSPVQVLDQLSLDQALLVQSLFVFQNLQRAKLFFFMVEAPLNNSKAALAQFLHHLVTVGQVLVHFCNVLLGVGVEAVICRLVKLTHLGALSVLARVPTLLPLIYGKEVDGLELKNFSLFHFPQEGLKHFECFVTGHWKLLKVKEYLIGFELTYNLLI